MSMPLEHWQERLDRHFQGLARRGGESSLPLFAFEHGLVVEETGHIGSLLRQHLAAGKRPDIYWLLWVVYATEIGYYYTGEEYWQSFEEQTPDWEFHHRSSLRRWFQKFQATYHGFEPSGPWAQNFSNISWPITHAILPKYLQYQFASSLYQLRYRLAGLRTLDSVSVGQLFATHTYNTTARFEKFLEQKELTGRIVLGLIGQAPQDGHEPIYPAALKRILDDLERIRSTRSWLRETRRIVTDRFKGIGHGVGPSTGKPRFSDVDERTAGAFVHQDIRPAILLRYSGAGKWAVAVEIPNFSPIAALAPNLRSFLKRTRCRLSRGTDTKPAGWTLAGNRVGIIKAWPEEDKPLLAFQGSHEILDRLLQTDFRISLGPNWLFRIGADGRAREIRGRNVHPGAAYILVSRDDLSIASERFIVPCTLECDGVHAIRISVPENLSAEDTSQIKAFGLEVSRTVKVWPVGLPCRGWDGEGQSEWLTTEYPQFGIVHDRPVTCYLVRLNNGTQISVDAPTAGEPVFVQLDPLPAGQHRLTVTAQRQSTLDDEPLTGYIELKVREPEPWVPGVPAHTGLVVGVDPHDADLDKFWANNIELSIGGPESHTVTCVVSLENSNRENVLSEKVGSALELPVRPIVWRRQFANVVNRIENTWRCMEASSGKLEIRAGELGNYVLRFEREVLPIRCVTRERDGSLFLRLIDDTGLEEDEATCQFYRMEHPVRSETCAVAGLMEGTFPPQPGGLYVAQHGQYVDALVVSNGLVGKGFQGLIAPSDCRDILTARVSVAEALRVLDLWSYARLVGFLPEIRRNRITRELLAAIYARICGPNWAKAESAFMDDPTSAHALDELSRRIGRNKNFNLALRKDHDKFREEIAQTCIWYAGLSRRYSVCNDSRALRVCRDAGA